MDHTHNGGDMSLYVPRKRKSHQSQAKCGVPCPVVQRMPERACELSVIGQHKNDESQAHDSIRMKRTYGRKRYEDLQSVTIGTEEYPTSSCAVMSSGGLANGADTGSLAPPTARLPPRLVAKKDVWPPGPECGPDRAQAQEQPWSRERGPQPTWAAAGRDRPQEQVWNSGSRDRGAHPGLDQTWAPGRDRAHNGPEQAWGATGRDRGPEQAWGSGRERAQEQAWNPGRDPGRERGPPGPEQGWNTGRSQDQVWSGTRRDGGQEPAWRPDLALKKAQRLSRNPPVISYPQPPDGRDSGSDSVNIVGLQTRTEPNMGQSSEDMKPPVIPIKKEPPVFPPGSQEERWQLQIVAKGRVTCPKCKSVSRKTVDGLKKHMENCRLQPFTCQHCGKQLKSSTGMKYHMMADHSNLPSLDETTGLDDRAVKDQLRKVLKRLGKLKCSKDGCSAAFTSIMGYMYHMKKCGKEESELEKLLLNCLHCGKAYKSKAGLEYHLKSEHAPAPERNEAEEALKAQREANPERTASGRVQRASAQVANFHLAEIASNDLPKDWPKRKFQSDLVPDDKKLKYARPGLPAFSQEVLRKWKNEVKLQRRVQCPNQGCGCTYSSVSGLKAHLGLCTMGDFEAGKYRCLICNKEFNSESGVKYHINSVHSQDWFVTNKKASKKFEQFLRNQPREPVLGQPHHCPHVPHHHQQHHQHHQHQQQPPHLQHQSSQQPLHPLHHLQQHAHFLHHHHHHHHQHHQMTPVTEMQQLQAVLQYTPLEPPTAGSTWVDVDQGAGHAYAQTGTPATAVPGGGEEAGRGREKVGREEGRTYGGGATACSSSSSSSNTGSSSSESEVEQQERQKQAELWNLERSAAVPGPAHTQGGGKRQRTST